MWPFRIENGQDGSLYPGEIGIFNFNTYMYYNKINYFSSQAAHLNNNKYTFRVPTL